MLIGNEDDRARVRGMLAERRIEIVAEAATLAEGRALATNADALVMAAAAEPLGIRELAQDLVAEDSSGKSKYLLVPRATHVSALFDSRVAKAAQDWAASDEA